MTNRHLSYLENLGIACVVCYVILFFTGWILSSFWYLIFSILLAFVLSDLIFNVITYFMKKADPSQGKDFTKSGHSLIIFVFGVILSTLLSASLADALYSSNQDTSWALTVLMTDFLAVIFVVIDLYMRFCEP